ncbi:MAG: hypothetical protein IJD69_00275 [Alphaproteobacteria bacterium]|nr:hypothetical protein [Alphaproteobacteria bacterium]
MPNLNVGLALAISANASIPSTAMAAGCLAKSCTTQLIYAAQGMNCATSTTNCYGDYKVLTCNSCNSGYTRTQQTTSVSGCDNSVTFYTCISNSSSGGDEEDDDCDGTCTDCTSTDWTSVATGYEKKSTATCNTSTCVCSRSTTYRCAANYYGSSGSTFLCNIDIGGSYTCSGCSPCPTHSASGYSGTSSAGTADATGCYITTAKSWALSDSTGSGNERFSSTCYYSN